MSIRIGVALDILLQIPTGHQTRNQLEGLNGNTQKGQDVWVRQVFPCYSLFVEFLSLVSG